jgi:hypothetical protein
MKTKPVIAEAVAGMTAIERQRRARMLAAISAPDQLVSSIARGNRRQATAR